MDERIIILAAVLCTFGIVVDTFLAPDSVATNVHTKCHKVILGVFTQPPEKESMWLCH
jgi:hypothetical protein